MARDASVWMPFYWGDYLRDTAHLDTTEHGAYLLLIAHYWISGKPIADDNKRMALVTKTSPDQWLEIRPTIEEFFSVQDGKWHHSRIDAEMGKASRKTAAKSRAGVTGGESKWASERAGRMPGKTRSERLTRAREKGTHTAPEWSALLDVCRHLCVNCGADDHIVKDHIEPIYQGGSDGIENLQPLCRSCNSSKGPNGDDLRPTDWRERLTERLTKRLTKRLSNACQTPAPSPSPSPVEKKETTATAVAKKSPVNLTIPKNLDRRKRKEGAGNGKPKRGTRLPDDWWPDAKGYEFTKNLGLDSNVVAPQFKDHWKAKPGKDGLALDWPARYRTWCRNEAKWAAERVSNRPGDSGGVEAARALMAEGE